MQHILSRRSNPAVEMHDVCKFEDIFMFGPPILSHTFQIVLKKDWCLSNVGRGIGGVVVGYLF